MILAYREPQVVYKTAEQRLKEIQENKPASWYEKLLKPVVSFFTDVILEFAIDVLSVVIPVAAIPMQIIKIGARFVKNVVVSAIAYGKIVWEDILISTALETALFGFGKGLRYISKLGNIGKKTAKSIQITRQLTRSLNRSLSQNILYASKKLINKTLSNSKTIASSSLKKFLNPRNVNKAIEAGRLVFASIRNPFRLITKTITKSRSLVKRQLKAKVANTMSKYYTKQLEKTVAKQQINKKLANKYIRANRLANKGQLYFNSSWISGVRLYDERYWDQSEFVTFFLYFKREATKSSKNKKGKRPLQFTMLYGELLNFLNAPSKGSYYLENWAWGWQNGKRININENMEFLGNEKILDKLFRISNFYNGEESIEELWQTQQYNKYVKSHRTNKNQYWAYKTYEDGNAKYKFTKDLSKAKSKGAYTRQPKRIRRK
ncbi:hypothetical protein [Mycoplasma seminis]|uniref:DUF31 domain-containing protein n=1 Tax=Mycoplasma seminis TaxID=512749 RepID=A0ABY9HA91_9MOLU|nr:hypothetical protein [Mycoplasma seminis]WLP85243.1 hypothetical protein Q8852_02885 [Mycoplasma seminis]